MLSAAFLGGDRTIQIRPQGAIGTEAKDKHALAASRHATVTASRSSPPSIGGAARTPVAANGR
jgi:hypothetical protein